jgi:hypothetical protein
VNLRRDELYRAQIVGTPYSWANEDVNRLLLRSMA